MSERNSPTSRYRQAVKEKNSQEERNQVRPGQIYLSSFRQLTQQNQDLIECIKELKRKNQEINLKIEQKLKSSRQHLQNISTSQQFTTTKPTQEPTPENNIALHNKFYRMSQSPTEEQRHSRLLKSQDSREKDSKDNKSNSIGKANRRKERNNHAYRIIKQSHLKDIEDLEKQTKSKSARKTAPKIPLFDQNEFTPQKDKIATKYFVEPAQILPQTTKIKKELNEVYLLVPKQRKQELLKQYNKKLCQLKTQTGPIKTTKDNKPYKVQLNRNQKYGSIYSTIFKQNSPQKSENSPRITQKVPIYKQ